MDNELFPHDHNQSDGSGLGEIASVITAIGTVIALIAKLFDVGSDDSGPFDWRD